MTNFMSSSHANCTLTLFYVSSMAAARGKAVV